MGTQRPLRVVIDHQVFARQRVGGMSRYICELARRLAQEPAIDVSVVAPLHVNDYLLNPEKLRVVGLRVPQLRYTGGLRVKLSGWAAARMVCATDSDVIHETYYWPTRRHVDGPPRVVTVYDLIPERCPEFFGPDAREGWSAFLGGAAHIVCISERTRADLLEIYQPDPKRVAVVPPASPFGGMEVASGPHPVGGAPFVLYVGSRASYKNFGLLLQWFGESGVSRKVRLLCVGGGPLTAAESQAMKSLGLSAPQITVLPADDETLISCYRNALALVYPSLYEGFGIPLLEAMSLGCPVICSNRGALPEVAGSAAAYFDPTDLASLDRAVTRVLGDDVARSALAASGRVRAAKYSWESSAHALVDIYRNVAAGIGR